MVLDRVYWHPKSEASEWIGVCGRPVKVKSVYLRAHHLIFLNGMIIIHHKLKHFERRQKWIHRCTFWRRHRFIHIKLYMGRKLKGGGGLDNNAESKKKQGKGLYQQKFLPFLLWLWTKVPFLLYTKIYGT